jgi:hypothetical protein
MDEPLISRDEVAALLFNVSDIARSLGSKRCSEATMGKKKLTKADFEARRQMVENAERTRQLAERAQAEIDKRKSRDR